MEEFSYIVLDLEWNQPMSGQETITQPFRFDSEIIEIGALKLNSRFEEVSEFKSFVRPVFYPAMNGHVVQLTKIRPQELEKAPDFPAAYAAFRDADGGVKQPDMILGLNRLSSLMWIMMIKLKAGKYPRGVK